MMALTPKRLFLSLCISISLLRSYTFFSRSPLVFKTLFENACELQWVVLYFKGVASLKQSGSRAIFGWPPVRRSASWKRKKKLRRRLFGAGRDQDDGKQAQQQANVRHFELSRKRISARMRTCQCMSQFVYDLRSRPLVRDRAARVRGQIASDHCRSDLITGRAHCARAGYPFPNLPESPVV